MDLLGTKHCFRNCYIQHYPYLIFPMTLSINKIVTNCLLEEKMATHSSTLVGKSNGQRSLVGYSPWGCKESDMTEHATMRAHLLHR